MCFSKEIQLTFKVWLPGRMSVTDSKGPTARQRESRKDGGSHQCSKGVRMNCSGKDGITYGLSGPHTARRGAKCIGNGLLLKSRGPTGLL